VQIECLSYAFPMGRTIKFQLIVQLFVTF
jgi:hypothetical protein